MTLAAVSITSAREIDRGGVVPSVGPRSEEHTSELQSQSNLVCRLLLEKKKTSSITCGLRSSSYSSFTISLALVLPVLNHVCKCRLGPRGNFSYRGLMRRC